MASPHPTMYPQGMGSYNNRMYLGGFKSWKGVNPSAVISKNIRPLTNKDPTNNAAIPTRICDISGGKRYPNSNIYPRQTQFLPRPMKHYRKGSNFINNRMVVSSSSATSVGQLMDRPGSFTIIPNSFANANNPSLSAVGCNLGEKIVSDYYPNKSFLTDNPTFLSQTPFSDSNGSNTTGFLKNCFNPEKKALNRSRSSTSVLPNTYFQTLQQYRENRCMTHDQRAFNFKSAEITQPNMYRANCHPNSGGNANNLEYPKSAQDKCSLVAYKPSNKKFATQGGVSSSAAMLRRSIDTIKTNITVNKRLANNPLVYNPVYRNKSSKICDDPKRLCIKYKHQNPFMPTKTLQFNRKVGDQVNN